MARQGRRITREVKLGAVFFGGVSLAIYENGVAQELLRMVRSTAANADDPADGSSEAVYSKLASYLAQYEGDSEPGASVQFVVDILSGTSAGGINAVFLGKALTLGLDLDTLHDLWINQADIDTLLNEKKSLADTKGLLKELRPTSLLNSQRMYWLLYEALQGMDAQGHGKGSLVEECDVWITATDLGGVTVPIRLSYQQANERVYKHAFHFKYDGLGTNQFEKAYNPALALAARCTSSFPAAFEPMCLPDMDDVLGQEARESFVWAPFFQTYVDNNCTITERYFADGGYLHNKPLSFAVDELLTRRAELPTERKLIYIDPFPESRAAEASMRPDVLSNLLSAAMTLPRYQTIREEVTRVMEHNRLVDRIERIVRQTGTDESPAGFYWNLRVSGVTDELAIMVGNALGFDSGSMETRAIRALLRVWREQTYPWTRESHAEYLRRYDLSFYIRRLDYILRRLDDYAPETRSAANGLRRPYKAAADTLCKAKDQLYRRSEGNPLSQWISGFQGRARGTDIAADPKSAKPSERMKAVFNIDRHKLFEILGLDEANTGQPLKEEMAEECARRVLGEGVNFEALTDIAERLSAYVLDAVEQSKKAYRERGTNLDPAVEADLNHLHDEFIKYDGIIFPITFGVDIGEAGPVDVVRISPADRHIFTDVGRPGRALMGDSLAAFAGFLDRDWRRSDMLWGRVDAAEQIITALLCEKGQEQVREEYVVGAVAAILKDEGLTNTLPATKAECARILSDFGRSFRTELEPAASLQLLRRSTKVGGKVLATAAEAMKGSEGAQAHVGRFLAGGLRVTAGLLSFAAATGGFLVAAFGSGGNGSGKIPPSNMNPQTPQRERNGLPEVSPGQFLGAHRDG